MSRGRIWVGLCFRRVSVVVVLRVDGMKVKGDVREISEVIVVI